MENNNKIHVFYYDDVTAEARDLEIDNDMETFTALLGAKSTCSILPEEISISNENYLIVYSDDPFIIRERSVSVLRNNRPYVIGRYLIMRLNKGERCSLYKEDFDVIAGSIKPGNLFCAKHKKTISKNGLILRVKDKNFNEIIIEPTDKDGKILYN